ncbi:unnamed protein product [Trifolium pratense]|uniref:Uncharacterized protein n=1 Tax=Trifolium pratense TaxID=57577 RepID=A0ACB0K6I8_TRIPR|nr:unnamed protein product [Trifolium pratense]
MVAGDADAGKFRSAISNRRSRACIRRSSNSRTPSLPRANNLTPRRIIFTLSTIFISPGSMLPSTNRRPILLQSVILASSPAPSTRTFRQCISRPSSIGDIENNG